MRFKTPQEGEGPQQPKGQPKEGFFSEPVTFSWLRTRLDKGLPDGAVSNLVGYFNKTVFGEAMSREELGFFVNREKIGREEIEKKIPDINQAISEIASLKKKYPNFNLENVVGGSVVHSLDLMLGSANTAEALFINPKAITDLLKSALSFVPMTSGEAALRPDLLIHVMRMFDNVSIRRELAGNPDKLQNDVEQFLNSIIKAYSGSSYFVSSQALASLGLFDIYGQTPDIGTLFTQNREEITGYYVRMIKAMDGRHESPLLFHAGDSYAFFAVHPKEYTELVELAGNFQHIMQVAGDTELYDLWKKRPENFLLLGRGLGPQFGAALESVYGVMSSYVKDERMWNLLENDAAGFARQFKEKHPAKK